MQTTDINHEAIEKIEIAAERINDKLSNNKLSLRKNYKDIQWNESNPIEILLKTKMLIDNVSGNLRYENSINSKMARNLLTGISTDINEYIMFYLGNMPLSTICSLDCKPHPHECHDCDKAILFSVDCFKCGKKHCNSEYCTNGHPWQLSKHRLGGVQ